MSSQQSSTACDTTFTPMPALLSNALDQAQQAESRLQNRKKQATQAFMAAQALYCGYLLIKWVWQGHYIGGPIYAVLVWCLLWILYLPVSLLWQPRKRALAKALRNVDVARIEAGKAFLASKTLGPYRWICRGGRMLGIFSESGLLYVLAPETGNRHALINATQVVKQVRVEEQTVTSSTSETTTQHGRRKVFAFSKNFGVMGKGTSHSTTTTTSSTAKSFTLHIQLQSKSQDLYWLQLPFAADWQEARNWQVLIEQAAKR